LFKGSQVHKTTDTDHVSGINSQASQLSLSQLSTSQVPAEAKVIDALADVLAEEGPDPSSGTSRYKLSKDYASSWLSTEC
jgi:hypothetical protein